MWKKDKNGKENDYLLDVISFDKEKTEKGYWWHACIREDGCINLDHAANAPFSEENNFPDKNRNNECDDYIHICDLDDYIKRLIALRDIAKHHFGEEWK